MYTCTQIIACVVMSKEFAQRSCKNASNCFLVIHLDFVQLDNPMDHIVAQSLVFMMEKQQGLFFFAKIFFF